MNWLPEHKCGLYISHNEHLDVYETVEEFYDPMNFISSDDWQTAVNTNNVWTLQWYPDTPIGSYTVCASSFEALKHHVSALKEEV